MHCVMESGREDGATANGIPWHLNSKVNQVADLSQKPKLEKSELISTLSLLMPGHIFGGIAFPLPGPLGGDVQDGWKMPDRDRDFPGHETFSQDFYSYPFLVVEPPPSERWWWRRW